MSLQRPQLFSLLVLPVYLFFLTGSAFTQDQCKPVGWATENGGVTGGGDAAATVVKNYTELKTALASSSVKAVNISGTITVPSGGMISFQDQSDKSVLGLAGSRLVSTDITSSGSGILYIKRCENIILRNIIFEGPGAYDVDGNDNLCIDNSRNVWVDHCEFHDGLDGNFDIKNMADFISVTWCTFSYEKEPKSGGSGGAADHRYSNLIGSSDNATGDEGHLRVTFNYCWWGEGCRERMPRMRFGKLHMVNNLFTSSVSNNCIRAGYKANILANGNYFDGQKVPIDEFNGDYTAIRAYDNAGAEDMAKNAVFIPPYTITAAKAADIVEPIKSCAGATLSDPTDCSTCSGSIKTNGIPEVAISYPATNSVFSAPAAIPLQASASDADGAVAKVEFYSGTTQIGTATSAPYTFTWENVEAGTYDITAKATNTDGESAVSAVVRIVVINPDKPQLSVLPDTVQTVSPGDSIAPFIISWGGAATGVEYSTIPAGLNVSRNSDTKSLVISGTPSTSGTVTVTTTGGTDPVSVTLSIKVTIFGAVLADWYPFQEAPPSLSFLSFTDASVETGYDDRTKPANGVAYTAGALRLGRGTGTMTLTLRSLNVLIIRWYATGGRTLKVIWGPTGAEYTWSSLVQYSSGAYEINLTAVIPGLISNDPVIVNIINDRTDGGTLNIHDLYVRGTADVKTAFQSRHTGGQTNESRRVYTAGASRLSITGTSRAENGMRISVISLLGRKIAAGDQTAGVSVRAIPRGVYLVKTGTWTETFIKK